LGSDSPVVVEGVPEAGRKPARYVPEVSRITGELKTAVKIPLAEAIRRSCPELEERMI